jgi:hypothetical protein
VVRLAQARKKSRPPPSRSPTSSPMTSTKQ